MGDSMLSSTTSELLNRGAVVSKALSEFPSCGAMGAYGLFGGNPSCDVDKCCWRESSGEDRSMGVVYALRECTLGPIIGGVMFRWAVEEVGEYWRSRDFSFESEDDGENITGMRCGRFFRMTQ
jgi:hypothetical protein